jgi:hypothetical protein
MPSKIKNLIVGYEKNHVGNIPCLSIRIMSQNKFLTLNFDLEHFILTFIIFKISLKT